jgi:hypothetical protein
MEGSQMITMSSRFSLKNARTATVLAAVLVAACSPQYSAPEQVQSSNPSVTYKYRGDQELIQANQNAMTFCSQYRSTPRAANIVNSDGGKTVIFECVAMAPAQQQSFNPDLTYNYRSDQELLDASRNAEIYCMNNGSQRAMSSVSTNQNGTRTVTSQCAPR